MTCGASPDGRLSPARGSQIVLVLKCQLRTEHEGPDANLRRCSHIQRQESLEPADAFGDITADDPRRPKSRAQPQAALGVRTGQAVGKSGAEVGLLGIDPPVENDPLGPGRRAADEALAHHVLAEREQVPGMTGAELFLLAGRYQLVGRVGLDRVEQPVPGVTRHLVFERHQRFVDQRGQQVEHPMGRDLLVSTHILGHLQAPSGEH